MLIDYLKDELARRTAKNSAYSLRAFARSLKIDSATLSALLSGRRPLTFKSAERILHELALDPDLHSKLLMSAAGRLAPSSTVEYEALSELHLEMIAGWEHFALLALLQTRNCKRSVKGMAAQLNLTPTKALAALSRLERLGFVRRETGKWSLVKQRLTTTQDIPSAALRRAHREYLERAIYSLDHHGVDERDITGITMAISKKKLPKAKQMIREFRRNLATLLEGKERDAVYRLNIQLFPIKK